MSNVDKKIGLSLAVYAFMWLLLAIHIADYWFRLGRVSPFGILMAASLIIGHWLAWFYGKPYFSVEGWKPRLAITAMLVTAVLAYSVYIVVR